MLVSSIYSPYQVHRTTQNWASYFNRMSYLQNIRAVRQNNSAQATGAITPVPKVPSVTPTLPGRSLFVQVNDKVGQDSLDFLTEYQDKLRVLGNSANRMRTLTKDFQAKLETAIQDKKIAAVAPDSKPAEPAAYEIKVEQLAQRQISTVRPNNREGSENTFRDGTLAIEVNRTDRTQQPVRGEVRINTQGKTDEQVKADLVSQINAQSDTLGLKASLVRDENRQPQIRIESKETGRSHAFTVTSADGKNQLEMDYDQLAQNLTYTVQKDRTPAVQKDLPDRQTVSKEPAVTREAESNQSVAIDPKENPDLKLDIKTVGKTQVTVEPNTKDLVKKTSDFVKDYNNTMDFLQKNVSRGTGVAKVRDTMTKHINKLGRAMEEIGISANKDGTLSFDEKRFQTQLNRNADNVRDTLERSNVAEQTYKNTRSGLQQSSASLLSNDYVETTQQATAFNRYYVQGLAAVSASSPAYLFQNPLFFNLYI